MGGELEVKPIRHEGARSRREAVIHATRSRCADCGGYEVMSAAESTAEDPDVVLVVRT